MNSKSKTVLFIIIFILSLIIIPLTYSKYTSTINKKVVLNIRKPIYTIKYFDDENNLLDSEECSYGTNYTIKNYTYELGDKTFYNWNTVLDGSGTTYNEGQVVSNLSSTDGDIINLYAQFNESSYYITYDFGGESFSGFNYLNADIALFSEENIHKDFEISVTLSDFKYVPGQNQDRNVIFCNQYEGGDPYQGLAFTYRENKIKIQGNSTSTAQNLIIWGKTEGTITYTRTDDVLYYDGNNKVIDYANIKGPFDAPISFGANLDNTGTPRRYGKFNLSNISIRLKYSSEEFDNLTLPNPTKTGYTFDGWYTEREGGTKINNESELTKGNHTLYAHWIPDEYTITFNANGGTGTMPDITNIEYGTHINLSKNTYTKNGYLFSSWNSKANGSGLSYTDEADVSNLGNITLYAQWKEPTGLVVQPAGENAKFLGGNITKKQIESVRFVTSIADANETKWNVSGDNDDAIIAWYTDDDNDGLYEVTIGADGTQVRANVNSSNLLSYIGNNANSDDSTCIYGLENLNTSKVTNMENMFLYCGSKAMTSLDLGNFNTTNVTNMVSMFNNCGYNLMTTLNLGSNFNTSKVTTMKSMFNNCGYKLLSSLDLGTKFDTSKVTNMASMFTKLGYESLVSINLGDKFDTSKCTNMEAMFNSCGYSLMTSLDLGTKFDTSKVTNMKNMFDGCGNLSMTNLDIRKMTFDTTILKNYTDIFTNSGKASECNVYANQDYETFIEDNKSANWNNIEYVVNE